MSVLRRRRKESRTRLFFATDIHGSERCFRKWLNARTAYRADRYRLHMALTPRGPRSGSA